MAREEKKILVIDDSSVNNLLLQNILEEENYKVIVAFSGREGLKLTESEKPDLILLDIMMPRMDGIEVLKRIKSSDKTVDIPVIMLTAKLDSADRKSSLEIGAIDYINKPVIIDELVTKVKNILQ